MCNTKLVVYFSVVLFAVLFFLGFVVSPWFCLSSFIPLIAATVLIIYKRHIKK